tara:strand:- start:311 stop:625 length:315 start_codon:yes stop_codon:yes gene_type:complete
MNQKETISGNEPLITGSEIRHIARILRNADGYGDRLEMINRNNIQKRRDGLEWNERQLEHKRWFNIVFRFLYGESPLYRTQVDMWLKDLDYHESELLQIILDDE